VPPIAWSQQLSRLLPLVSLPLCCLVRRRLDREHDALKDALNSPPQFTAVTGFRRCEEQFSNSASSTSTAKHSEEAARPTVPTQSAFFAPVIT